ncbi:hypothetical protein [Actinophytocola sp.]|jgi:small-conductance mechanosensitive channel|uniref:hypothetical protein n=1 Tax=Actinophytocola sp. TaxID=1872138 RepID=UPI002EDAC8BD
MNPTAYPAHVPAHVPAQHGVPPWHTPPALPPVPVAGPPRRRRGPVVLVALLIAMTVAAGTFGALYVSASGGESSATAAVAAKDKELRDARAELTDARTARKEAEASRDEATSARDDATGRASTAEATAQRLQACQLASKDLLTALKGDPKAPQTQKAATDALTRMSIACQ